MNTFAIIAFRNVRKNWRHSLAAIISISAGFVSLALFQGYTIDVEKMYKVGYRNRSMYGDLLIENPGLRSKEGRAEPEKFFMLEEDQKKIETYLAERKQDVEARVRMLTATGMVTNGKSSTIFLAEGYDIPEGVQMRGSWRWDATVGEPLYISKDSDTAIIGQGLGALMGCTPTPPLTRLYQNQGYPPENRPFHCDRPTLQLSATTESGQLNALDLKVVGLSDAGYKAIDERWVMTSLENLQTLMNTKKVRMMSVMLKDPSKTNLFRDQLNAWLKEQNLPYQSTPWEQHPTADLFQKTMSLLVIFKVFIVVVILTISGLSVLNTMIKTVKERTKEIGTLRSLGYEVKQVRQIFLYEAFFLSLLGVLIGVGLSLIFTFTINHIGLVYKAGMLSQPALFMIAFDALTYFISLVLLVGLAIATSYMACRGVMKSRVAENLTYA